MDTRHPGGSVTSRLASGFALLFAVLLLVGLVRRDPGSSSLLVGCAAALTLAWFVAGRLLARGDAPRRRAGTRAWLAGLTLSWLALVAVSSSFVWVAFPVWMLLGLHLRWWSAALVTGVMWACGVAALAARADRLTVAGALGPAVGGVVALGLGLGMARLIREIEERRRLLDELSAAQAETAALQDELALAQREAGAEDERTRLSREIHDTLAQGFSSIVLVARAAQRDPAADTRAALRRIEMTAGDNLAEARRVVAALAPAPLAAGLPGALTRLLDGLSADTGLGTALRVDGDATALPANIEVALLRAAQSALANVRAHAQARTVVMTLSVTDDAARLDIVDDGRGFDLATLPDVPGPSGGYGIASMRARLAEHGGGLDVESAPGEGTAVAAWVPRTPPPHGRKDPS